MKLGTQTIDCPECYESCGWCSWWRYVARDVGCGLRVPNGFSRTHERCEKYEALKGTKCGTCDGSGKLKVNVERAA